MAYELGKSCTAEKFHKQLSKQYEWQSTRERQLRKEEKRRWEGERRTLGEVGRERERSAW